LSLILPDWLVKARQRRERAMAEAARQLAPPPITVPSEAPGWHEVGMEFSYTPPAGFEADSGMVRALRAEFPDLVPLWVNWIFKKPVDSSGAREEVCFGRWAMGRVVDVPGADYEPLKITNRPQVNPPPQPHLLEAIFQRRRPRNQAGSDLPGAYVPMGWEVYHWVKETYGAKSVKEIKAAKVDRPRARKEAAEEAVEAEEQYIQDELAGFIQRKLETISDVQWREIADRDLGATPRPQR